MSALGLCGLLLCGPGFCAPARDYTRLVVLSDLHLPGRLGPLKRRALETVNAWPDVDAVVALGDIVETTGSREEYAFAKSFLSQLRPPLYPVAGNHEYIYVPSGGKKLKRGTRASQRARPRLFQETFSLPALHYEKRFGPYLVLFVSVDAVGGRYLTELSPETLLWLGRELRRHRRLPTIVFFHAPLEGTLRIRREDVENSNLFAQPKAPIRELIRQNPQIFLWVSGHAHIAPTNARFNNPLNLYEGRVTGIHNCDLDGRSALKETETAVTEHDRLWINSLFLYADRVVVKTYDLRRQAWLEELTRVIRPPEAFAEMSR